jgi:hypothetical protein
MLNYGHVESYRQSEIIRKLRTAEPSETELSSVIEKLKSYADHMPSKRGV